jgi:hypothetical protein
MKWRSLKSLANVVGLDADTTRRLLLEIGARGSEKSSNVWSLASRSPLRERQIWSEYDPDRAYDGGDDPKPN